MKQIFLDGASNTPLDKTVFRTMKPYLTRGFVGNSASIHDFGIKAAIAVEHAREQVAQATRAKPEEIFFTSGATEGNNWIIKMVATQQLISHERKTIICGATEHSSVLKACEALIPLGFNVKFIKPNSQGKITAFKMRKHINDDTALVCIMSINNELGTANEVDAIAQIAKKHGAISLIDCTQMMLYGGREIEICRRFPHGDCFTFSAHKFYGPTGVGCVIVRQDISLTPLLYGGAQEFGKRGGTSNTAGIVGLGKAIEMLHQNNYRPHFMQLFSYFIKKMGDLGDLNVIPDHQNILSVNLSKNFHTDNLAAILATQGIAVSAGSACDAEHDDITGFNPSHVLLSLGLSEKIIKNTVRVSFTKYTTKKDIDIFFGVINNLLQKEQL